MPLVDNFKKYFFIFLLFIVEIILFLTNYESGTWLLGWDSYGPDLNFKANLARSVYGVWQEYRGLGLLDGMAHTANLLHTLIVWALSFFLPSNLRRYFFHFLVHFLAGVGIYRLFLLIDSRKSRLTAFIASLFYLLNIGTVQMFYTPLEAFSVHFCALPWLSWALIKYWQTGFKKDLLWFFVLSVLFTPQSLVPTLFIIYLGLLFLILAFHFKTKQFLKKALLILTLTFLANAFWLLPYGYSVAKNAEVITASKINQSSNENILLRNKQFGNFESAALIHGFSLGFTDSQSNGKLDYLMSGWIKHLDQIGIKIISWAFFASAILGTGVILGKKKKSFYPFLTASTVAFLMLGNEIPILSLPFSFLTKSVPFFIEAFRFVFTKFSILYVLGYSLLLAVGLEYIFSWDPSTKFEKAIKLTGFLIFFISLIFYSWPAFNGHFFYQSLKVKIPQEYFELIDSFKTQDKNMRLAILPQADFWGWTRYGWGFRGSGFIWQGLPQASLDGAFLPWSRENENFYWQLNQAIQAKNLKLFESILEKYQINFLVLDENIRAQDYKALCFDKTRELFNKSSKVSFVKKIGNRPWKITIYQVNLKKTVKNFVFVSDVFPQISPKYNWNNYDLAYLENGDYFSDSQSLPQVYYPFRSLFTGRSQKDLEFNIENKENYFLFKAPISQKLPNYYLEIPPSYQKALLSVASQNLANIHYQSPEIYYNGNILEAIIPKIKGYFSANIEAADKFLNLKPKNCDQFHPKGIVENEIIQENRKKFLRLSATNAYNCSASFWLPDLPHQYAYLITVESRNLEGQSLLFWLENLNIRKADIESYLPQDKETTTSYFIQPPMEKDGLGYTLHFDNISIGQAKATNDLGKITVNLIPFDFLASLKLVPPKQGNNNYSKDNLDITDFEVSHPNPSFYKVKINNLDNTEPFLLTLSQSFEKGWIASQGKHVLVNNWANGWLIDSPSEEKSQEIIIFFWPQLLEYLGFLLIPVSFILVKKLKC